MKKSGVVAEAVWGVIIRDVRDSRLECGLGWLQRVGGGG